MYGLGSLLSSIGTAAAAPALSTATMSATSDWLKDLDWSALTESEGVKDFLSEAAGGTLGTALSMGLGAGLGAATGGSAGAAGGALTGLVSGAGAAMQHDKFKEAMGLGALDKAPQVLPQGERPSVATESPTLDYDLSKRVSGIGIDQMKQESAALPATQTPTPAKAETKILDKDKPSYFGLTGELGMPALTMGMGLMGAMQQGQAAQAYRKKKEQEEQARLAEIQSLMQRVYGQGYAEGGMTVSNPTNPPTTVKFPEWFVDEFAKSGGLQSLAHGGYINTQEFDPNTAHPLSEVPRAQPYPAASPVRNEVLDFADGGLLEGEGHGMSDDIPANIEGQEEIRVADGEYVIPKDAAKKFGEDRLEDMLTKVRAAAHAKKGAQVIEDAGKKAFIRCLTGIKA